MSDREKTETFDIREIKEKKPQVNRSANDEYSAARRNSAAPREEKGSGALIYIAVFLSAILITVVVAGIIILRPGQKDEIIEPDDENMIVVTDEEEETKKEEVEKEEEVEKNLTLSCSMVFYSDSVSKKGNGFVVSADLFDDDFYKFDNKKLIIDNRTDIREDGKRLSHDALMYIIENMGGDGIVFDGEINNSEGRVLSISFDGSFRKELEKEEEKKEESSEGIVFPIEENEEVKEETTSTENTEEKTEETPSTETTEKVEETTEEVKTEE